ncbi:hypothetical protein WJX73_006451 [Symbiochloris irregularis]|uniref:Uncharacterized protein n=1 Tax=Symbiochloris irregularis TaxID=706552 RepID=A0AAW1NM90_9CHLO
MIRSTCCSIAMGMIQARQHKAEMKIDQHLLSACDLVVTLDPEEAAEAFLEHRGKQHQEARTCAQQQLQHHMALMSQQAPVLSWAAEHMMQKFFTAARQAGAPLSVLPSLMRLTVAAARLLHHPSVEVMDVMLAILMLLMSWETLGSMQSDTLQDFSRSLRMDRVVLAGSIEDDLEALYEACEALLPDSEE